MRGAFSIKAVNTWGLGLSSTNREGTKRYFHFDAVGSTRALTDSSETVTDTYEYNAFGVVESSTGTSVNPFRYVGQYGYYDDGAMGSASGLLLLGVRYYSPAHGRSWSWDPVPNLNLYAYVNNSATMAIEPSMDFSDFSSVAGGQKPPKGATPVGPCKEGKPGNLTPCGEMCDSYTQSDFPRAHHYADCELCCSQIWGSNRKALAACLAAFCVSPRRGWTPCRCAPRKELVA